MFETHAPTQDNERGIATGWLPGQLSSRGEQLALELGRRRRADGLAAVFSSDLHRAVQTVQLAFPDDRVPVFPHGSIWCRGHRPTDRDGIRPTHSGVAVRTAPTHTPVGGRAGAFWTPGRM